LPAGLVLDDELGQFLERSNGRVIEAVFAEGDNVEPSLFGYEGELVAGRLRFRLDILGGTCLEEESNIVGVDLAGGDEDLEAHHEHEGDLVLLEEPSIDVLVDVLGQEFDDDVDTLRRRLRLIGVIDGFVEEHQELLQRAIVHPVHE